MTDGLRCVGEDHIGCWSKVIGGVVFAFHDGADLGGPMMARVARQFGYSVDELRRL